MSIFNDKPTQRSLNTLETKNNLYGTALSLFDQYGYDEVTVEDITRRAGLSKGTFYNHFASKESVILEMFQRIDSHYETVFQSVPDEESASERMLTLINAMCEYCADAVGISLLRVVYAHQVSVEKGDSILNNRNRFVYRLLMDIAARGKNSGEFTVPLDNEELAEYCARFMRGLLYDWCLYNGSFDLKEEGDRYFRLLLSMLKGAPFPPAPPRKVRPKSSVH